MDNKQIMLAKQYSLSSDVTDLAMSEGFSASPIDRVLAVHSPYWPVEATEWIPRTRCHNLPSKPVIKHVIRYGCDFVQVSHNRLSNDNEWRFSFSKADLFIIKSWSILQRTVYITIWLLNRKVTTSSNFCTYYLKTLIFLVCEEKPAQF